MRVAVSAMVADGIGPERGYVALLHKIVVVDTERGVGRQLFELAGQELYAAGARAVFGEVHRDAPERLARFMRWGASVVDFAYVQPSLGPGLPPAGSSVTARPRRSLSSVGSLTSTEPSWPKIPPLAMAGLRPRINHS